jgi:hypothetical protein
MLTATAGKRLGNRKSPGEWKYHKVMELTFQYPRKALTFL